LNSSENQQEGFQHACTCGLISITNRRLAYNSGLFYEDFIEIISFKYDCKYLYKKAITREENNEGLSNKIMELIENKYSCPFLTFYEHIEIYSSKKINDVLSD
jgi:hypothetical protein